MRGGHEIPPHPGRKPAAGDLFHPGTVVVAHPDAGQQVSGEAHEPGVAEVLAGAGLAGLGPADLGGPPGAAGNDAGKHGVHGLDVPGRYHPPGAGAAAPVKDVALAVLDFLDPVGPYPGAAVGEGAIGLGQLQKGHLGYAQRQAGRRLEIARKAQPPGGVDDPGSPRPFAHLDGDGVDGPGHRLGQGDLALMGFAEIAGPPAADVDGPVHHERAGAKAGLQPGKVDEGLERRPRLALSLGGAVELAFRVVAATDHGADRARGLHRHQGGFRHAGLGALFVERPFDRRFGQVLQIRIKGGMDDDIPVARIDVGGHLFQHPIGEMAARPGPPRERPQADMSVPGRLCLFGGLGHEHPGGDHVF